MSRDPRKIVAAAIGVVEYLKTEQVRARQGKTVVLEAPPAPGGQPIQPSGSHWAASGRMELMHFRNLMELRIFRRGR